MFWLLCELNSILNNIKFSFILFLSNKFILLIIFFRLYWNPSPKVAWRLKLFSCINYFSVNSVVNSSGFVILVNLQVIPSIIPVTIIEEFCVPVTGQPWIGNFMDRIWFENSEVPRWSHNYYEIEMELLKH